MVTFKILLITTFEVESMHALIGQIRILILLIKIIMRIIVTGRQEDLKRSRPECERRSFNYLGIV